MEATSCNNQLAALSHGYNWGLCNTALGYSEIAQLAQKLQQFFLDQANRLYHQDKTFCQLCLLLLVLLTAHGERFSGHVFPFIL